jgi:diguanylate cyclase (GGDEF)-like protein
VTSPSRRAGRWLRRQPAHLRLRWAFSLLIGLLLLVAGLAAARFHEYERAVSAFASGSMQRIRVASEISADVGRVSRQLLTLVTGERDLRATAYRNIDIAHSRLETNVELLRQASDMSGRRLNPLATALATYRGAYDETVDRIETGDAAGVRAMMANRTEEALSRLSELADAQVADEQARAQSLAQEQAQQVRQDMLALALICLVAIIGGGLLARAVRRSISEPLQRTEAVARRLAAGDYRVRAQVRGKDELAGLAATLNTLAEAVAQREAQIRHLAETDAETGLSQRGRFQREVSLQLSEAKVHVLLCLDLEGLKTINAVLGYEAGDAAIRCIAQRLQAQASPHSCIGRLGGGTFAMLLPLSPGLDLAEQALVQVQHLRAALERPFDWQGQSSDLHLLVGAALHPLHTKGSTELLRCAEQALFEAKRRRSGTELYSDSQAQARLQDLNLASELQLAQEQGQLVVFLQPKLRVTLGGQECTSAEALIRWQHPERGFISPAEFIPFAERTGRIRRLTQWMLGTVIGLLARTEFEGLRLAVNLSTKDLHDPQFDQHLRRLLLQHGVEPARLTLEITESGLMDPGEDPVTLLHRLKSVGVRLAIDDFGTGHSALAYLQRLPVDELKIDRSFVRDVDLEPKRYELLAAIAQLGHTLGMTVTAEGVEREAELLAVRRAGCQLVQGYFTGRPMSVDAFLQWREKEK